MINVAAARDKEGTNRVEILWRFEKAGVQMVHYCEIDTSVLGK